MRHYLARHGHAVSQLRKDIVVGRSAAAPLDEKGKGQAEMLCSYMARAPVARIFASPLVRTRQTAEILARGLRLDVEECGELIERSQGDFEGKAKDLVYTPELIKVIHADQLAWSPPGGESLTDVAGRLGSFFETRLAKEASPCLVVTHLMVLWALFHMCTRCHHSLLPHLKVDNCALVEIELDPGRPPMLIRWNVSTGEPGNE